MIAISFFLLIFFTLGQTEENKTIDTKIDLKAQMKKVIDSAHNHIYHEMPNVNDLFFIKDSPELLSMESTLKSKIIQDLLNQLVEVWAEMNVRILRGFTVMKNLRDKAKELVEKLEKSGGGHLLKKQEIRQKLSDRVKELLDTVKIFFCGNENDSTFFFAETHLRNISSRLESENVKKNLLKVVYYNRIFGIANLTDFQHTQSEEQLLELWALVTSWGKWAVLDLMVYIREPLKDLNSEINDSISSFVMDIQALTQDIASFILEILTYTNNDKYNEYLSQVLNGIENKGDITYSLC